jgi:hypothetical protein
MLDSKGRDGANMTRNKRPEMRNPGEEQKTGERSREQELIVVSIVLIRGFVMTISSLKGILITWPRRSKEKGNINNPTP